MTPRDRIRRLAGALPDLLPDAELALAERVLVALVGGPTPAAAVLAETEPPAALPAPPPSPAPAS